MFVKFSGCEGEFGELYIRGPSLFKEYYKRPKETEATYTKDGWFKTGKHFSAKPWS